MEPVNYLPPVKFVNSLQHIKWDVGQVGSICLKVRSSGLWPWPLPLDTNLYRQGSILPPCSPYRGRWWCCDMTLACRRSVLADKYTSYTYQASSSVHLDKSPPYPLDPPDNLGQSLLKEIVDTSTTSLATRVAAFFNSGILWNEWHCCQFWKYYCIREENTIHTWLCQLILFSFGLMFSVACVADFVCLMSHDIVI